MLTFTAPARTKAAYRPFRAQVSRVERLSPHFIRVTFTGADLSGLGHGGLDQRIKIAFPLPGLGTAPFQAALADPAHDADWYAAWRSLPDRQRNSLRTYTIRSSRCRDGERELDVDFVEHGDGGPATAWVRAAAPGDELLVIGPDAHAHGAASGIAWQPPVNAVLLLAGDESAAPAICSILESLEPDAVGQAFIEIPTLRDILPVIAPEGVEVTWLPRGNDLAGSRLEPAVRRWTRRHLAEADLHCSTFARLDLTDIDVDDDVLWEVPAAGTSARLYAWIAGEAGAVKEIRRFLIRDTGFDRSQVAFMGYWRHGRSESA